MGQSESSQHIPNPIPQWKTRIAAELVQCSEIVRTTDWKMNSLASLPVAPYSIFLSRLDSIYVYNPTENNEGVQLQMTVKAGQKVGDSINQMRMLNIGGTLRLVAVFDSGLVAIWDPQDMSKAPIKLQNDNESTWSLSASVSMPLLYVGSNSHEVASFDLSAENIQKSREIVAKHNHNVPCIDVTPCGKWMATASIDGTVLISEIATMRPLVSVPVGTWGWSCKWLLKKDVKRFKPKDQIEWLSDIYRKDTRRPSLESVATDHYHALKDDSELVNGPVTKKRALKFPSEDLAPEADAEEDGEFNELVDDLEEEMEFDIEENGFEREEDEEVERDAEEANVPFIDARLESRTPESESSNPSHSNNPWQTSSTRQRSKPHTSEKDSPEDYLLSVATLDEIILFDSELKMLSRFTRPLVIPNEDMSSIAMVDRFALLQWIPEWSLLVAANQGLASVLLLTVRFNTTTFSYELVPEMRLPHAEDKQHDYYAQYALSGVDFYRMDANTMKEDAERDSDFAYRFVISNGDLFVYDVKLVEGKISATIPSKSS